jgi:hypothetical protein
MHLFFHNFSRMDGAGFEPSWEDERRMNIACRFRLRTALAWLALLLTFAPRVDAVPIDPDRALIFTGETTLGSTFGQLETALASAGASGTDVAAVLPADLTPYRFIMAYVPNLGLNAAEQAALIDFYGDGGFVIGVGEHSGIGGNSELNSLATSLGIGLSIIDDNVGSGFAAVNVHPLMDGVDALLFAAGSRVSGGVPLASYQGSIILAVEDRFLMSGDSNIFSDGLVFPPGNLSFFSNIWASAGAVSVPEPSTLMLFGIGLLGLGWMGRRRKNV